EGPKGDKGDKGEDGAQGAEGPKGDKGDKGEDGAQGVEGPKGDKGDKGEDGAQGAEGPKGDKGDKGEDGAQGVEGPKGDKGDKGDKGEDGAQGVEGPKGDKGDKGADGVGGVTTRADRSPIIMTGTGEHANPYVLGVAFNNGLQQNPNNANDTQIQLGGPLVRDTELALSGKKLMLSGLNKDKTQAVSNNQINQHLVAVDAVTNEVKALKAAMPKFFYMPSIAVPTAASQATQTGVSFDNAMRRGTIELYTIYQNQYGTTVKSSPGAAVLPVLQATDLGYHVTFASDIFTVESITETGVLTYTVSASANGEGINFMNIVFTVNED
ncbi:hypothetical protein ACPDHL_15960, partial [Myroides sp. C15-4]